MRTAAFIDGFNLYYGVLKNSAYKWLDIHALFSRIVREQNPAYTLSHCGYYSAMIKGSIATRGQNAVCAQQAYHKALKSNFTPNVNVVLADHNLEPRPLPQFRKGEKPDKQKSHMVWRLEEKQTDVALALDAYRMAASGQASQIVICSNDTDLVPLLKAIRTDFPTVSVGLVIPRKKLSGRPAARQLTELAHWTRSYITERELAECQFPDKVPTDKKPAFKPRYW